MASPENLQIQSYQSSRSRTAGAAQNHDQLSSGNVRRKARLTYHYTCQGSLTADPYGETPYGMCYIAISVYDATCVRASGMYDRDRMQRTEVSIVSARLSLSRRSSICLVFTRDAIGIETNFEGLRCD